MIATPAYLPGSEFSEGTTTATSISSGSFTPSAGALVMAFIANMHGSVSATAHTINSDTFGAQMGAWTKIGSTVTFNNGTNRYGGIAAFWAIAGASPVAGTVAFGWTQSTPRISGHCIEIASGFDTTTPILQNASNTGTGTTLSVTLSALAAGSIAIGMIGSADDAGGITPGAQFTELREIDSGGTGTITNQSQYDASSPGTTVDWSALAGVTSGAIAFEVQEDTAVGTDTTDVDRAQPRGQERGHRRGQAFRQAVSGLFVPDRRLLVPVGIQLSGAR